MTNGLLNKKFNIDKISETFKLPISYLEKKSLLEKNIHSDLELTELKDDNSKGLYNTVFEPTNTFSKITTNMWSKEFTTDKKFLKDSQNLYKKIKNINFMPSGDIDELIKIYDEIKNDYSFKDKYNYVEWQIFEHLNYNSFFLLIISLLNICSPVFSLITPIFILLIPLLFLKLQGISIDYNSYTNVLRFFGKILPIVNILNFHEMPTDKKVMTSVSIVIYFFSLYQNTISVYRFHKNMIIIHKYLDKLKSFNNNIVDNIDNYLLYSSNYESYASFNYDLQNHKKNLISINSRLNSITPYSVSISKIMNLGNVMSNLYSIYKDEYVNRSLLYSFGLYGYLENIHMIQYNIDKGYINKCKYSKNKTVFKKSYYAPLKDQNPVTNTYNINKNILITGPNAAGKTTILKSSLFNIILSQQIGYGFYSGAEITPFDNIHCYLNIPDTSNRDSLFQAEARRCKDIIDTIDKDSTQTHFCIFDELYSGTNPYEAVASATSYLSYLCENKNVKFIITTHYVELCEKLNKLKKNKIINKHMKVSSDKTGNFQFTYKLVNDISTIKGGIKVLKDLKYPTKIIESTENYIN